jgi:hypothetical protein
MALFTLDTMSQAGSWQELSAGFRWQVPARFNLGWDCRSSTAFVTPVLLRRSPCGARAIQ